MIDMLDGSPGNQVDKLVTEYERFSTGECIAEYLTVLVKLPEKVSSLSGMIEESKSQQQLSIEERGPAIEKLAKLLVDIRADLTILLALDESGFTREYKAAKIERP